MALLSNLFSTKTEPADMNTVSKWTHVHFPPSAKLKHSLGINHSVDYELYAQIEMSREDTETLVAALKKKPYITLSRNNRMNITNSARNWRKDTPIPKWWNPDSARRFIASDTGILISLDNPNRTTVWVHRDSDRM